MGSAPVVDTALGKLRGNVETGVAVFRGIPFAGPPVGALRFRPPQPAAPWTGVRDALEFGPSATQLQLPMSMLPGGYDFAFGMPPASDDCLYLNVWTPACDGAKRPVMVWIHGGGFIGGSGADTLYNGTRLAARGDVVVVTVNYRLGAIGLLHLDDDEHPPNRAVQDWVAALRWVQENIEGFGGDASNVTIFGESAGAIAVSTLLAVPSATSLYHRAIMQSGGGRRIVTTDRALENAEFFLHQLDLKPGMIHELLETPTEKLLNATLMTFAQAQFKRDTITGGFEPCIDGDLITSDAVAAVRSGGHRDLPMIVGTTRDEMTLTRAADGEFNTVDDKGILGRAEPLLGDSASRIVGAYRAAHPGMPSGELWEHILNGREMRMPAVRLCEAQAAAGGAAYSYIFSWESPAEGLGATHGIDLGFTFGNFDDVPGHEAFGGTGPQVRALSDTMQDLWIAFARGGSPAVDAISWPAYDVDARPTLLLGADVAVAEDPDRSERQAWN